MQGMLMQMAQPGVMQGMLGGMAPPQFTDPATSRTFTLDVQSGQLLELRIPTTVTERLAAQAMLGIGQTVSPVGRKASGQAPPKQETKNDEPGGRTTITESNK
jgi:hypothetical protein